MTQKTASDGASPLVRVKVKTFRASKTIRFSRTTMQRLVQAVQATRARNTCAYIRNCVAVGLTRDLPRPPVRKAI